MKKITSLIILLFLFININSCSGYKPIFSSSNFQFKIADSLIEGDKKLGNQIYSKLYNLSKSNKNNANAQSIAVSIDITKDKKATVKDGAGKVLEYRIILTSNIIIKDYLTDDKLLNKTFSYSSAYKTQDQHTETIKLENKSIEDLVNKIYQNLLIEMSQII